MTPVQILPPGFPHVAERCSLPTANRSANSYANHLAECSHLHRLPGGPMSHGKSERKRRRIRRRFCTSWPQSRPPLLSFGSHSVCQKSNLVEKKNARFDFDLGLTYKGADAEHKEELKDIFLHQRCCLRMTFKHALHEGWNLTKRYS